MKKVLLTPQADLDLLEIGFYIAKDNLKSAEETLLLIDQKCRLLLRSPEMGRQREELAAGLRSFPAGSYLIFYRVIQDGIEVIRVLHGARDIPNALP